MGDDDFLALGIPVEMKAPGFGVRILHADFEVLFHEDVIATVSECPRGPPVVGEPRRFLGRIPFGAEADARRKAALGIDFNSGHSLGRDLAISHGLGRGRSIGL